MRYFQIGLHLFDQIDKAFIKYIISLQKQIKLITKKKKNLNTCIINEQL
jgi:hypothetical protein